jgi:serine/threonine protein kinase, bacterial
LHRDVKPANVLLAEPDEDSKRRILLADFGIARPLADISGLTATNFTVGTVAYAAPEQLMGADVDGRADQYALAATAFHLLTGAPPYQHSNPVAVIGQHLNAALPKLSDRRRDLAHLDQVLSKALAKDAADRFDRCRDFVTKLSERAGFDAVSDRPTEAGITVAAPKAGSEKRRIRPRILLGAAIAVVVFTVIGGVGYMIKPRTNATPAPAPSAPARPAAVLDGTYSEDLDLAKMTVNSAPDPERNVTHWWAFRSACTASGCVAAGTKLDDKNHQSPAIPADTTVLHFVDRHWQAVPHRRQMQEDRCLGGNATVVPGENTQTVSWSLLPQPDGTLQGVFSGTILTNECGHQGAVVQNTSVLTRMGDVPPGVNVADPATVPASSATSIPAPAVAGPVLEGTYRLDIDPGDDPTTSWWAFRSSCTSTGCVATGTRLSDTSHQQATGSPTVLHFDGGRCQDTPYLAPPVPCPHQNATFAGTQSWSLEPEPDGTLRGTSTIAVLTNECGNGGTVFQSPVVATRTGDVAPTVTVADPALF